MAYKSQPMVIRPANVTPYAAGDVVGGAIQFPELTFPGEGHLKITAASLRIDIAAIPAGMAAFRLHLYNGAPPSNFADNAAWDLPAGDRGVYLGYIDLVAPIDLGATLFTQADGLNKQVQIPSGGRIYGYLVTIGGFTPAANSEVYCPCLCAINA